MTITVDCRFLNSNGIGIYLRECLPYFFATEHQFFLLGNKTKLEPIIGVSSNVHIIECSIRPFSLKELFIFPRYMLKQINATDCYYTPYFNIPGGIKIPVFSTIHDIIFLDLPSLVSIPGFWVRRWFYRRASQKSILIFTVSEFSKSRIQHHLHNKQQIIVTYSAIQRSITRFYSSNQLQNTIIFIGSLKRHKGLSLLIQAFNNIRDRGLNYSLLIVGSNKNLRSKEKTLSILHKNNPAIVWIDSASSEQLNKLIHSSALLVQPSLYEGFGLPPLEALTLGTPALISDIPVFKEIYHDFPVVFFNSGDVNDLQDKMFNILYNKVCTRPVVLTNIQKKRYTFEKTAAIILERICKTIL